MWESFIDEKVNEVRVREKVEDEGYMRRESKGDWHVAGFHRYKSE